MSLTLLAYPQVVFSQSSQPEAVIGRLWIDTDDGSIYYSSDGSTFTKLNVNVGDVQTPVIENALNILQIQASETLTTTDSASIIKDIYSDSGGYKNTIDTGNTTATFGTDENSNNMQSYSGTNNDYTMTFKALKKGFVSAVSVCCNGQNSSTNGTISIIQNSVTLASWTGTIQSINYVTHNFVKGDYSSLIDPNVDGGTFTIHVKRNSGSYSYVVKSSATSFNGSNFSYNSQIMSGTAGTGTNNPILVYETEIPDYKNGIVQTNEQTLSSTPTHFQIFTYDENINGTGSINYDISFDSGSNYQTGISSNVASDITNTGTGMIIKQNLTAGATGAASARGYGVFIW